MSKLIQNSLLDQLNSLHIKNHNQTLLIDIWFDCILFTWCRFFTSLWNWTNFLLWRNITNQSNYKKTTKNIYISLTLMVFRWFERLQWIKMRTPVLISITGQKIDFPKKFCNKNITFTFSKNSNYWRSVKSAWVVKEKHCWAFSTNFWKEKVCWHHPAIFCLVISSKISHQ